MRLRMLSSAVTVAAVTITTVATHIPPAGASASGVALASMGTGSSSLLSRFDYGSASPLGTKSKVCYSQGMDQGGIGILSQDFEDAFDTYDAEAADDFTPTKKCTITEIHLEGEYFNGSGPADAWRVRFYKSDKAGLPGKVFSDQTVEAAMIHQSLDPDTGKSLIVLIIIGVVAFFCFKHPESCSVSIQAKMDFSKGGEWGWATTNQAYGKPAVWRNPGDGFGTGCTNWGVMQNCVGDVGEGPDFAFSLIGGTK